MILRCETQDNAILVSSTLQTQYLLFRVLSVHKKVSRFYRGKNRYAAPAREATEVNS